MKVDFNAEIKTLDGEGIRDDKGTLVTLKSICVQALIAAFQDEQDLAGVEKLKRYELAREINHGGEIQMSAENVVLLKKLIAKGFNVLVVGQTYGMLEGDK